MIRVISNYARLVLTFVLGIVVVRLMAEIDPDAVLIYLLLISSSGIAAMFKFALQNALVPALGLSIDGQGEHDFPTVLWTSFVLGVASGVLSLVLFGGFWLMSDRLNLGELSQRTIAFAIGGTALQAFSSSVGIVFLNLILVERRIVIYNILLVLDRAVILLAAVLIFLLPEPVTIDVRIQVFYGLAGLLTVLLQLATYWLAVRDRPDLRIRREALRRDTTRWIAALIGWNAVVVVAFALFTRWPPLIVNWTMNETMTLTISIVLTLIGYQRQLSMGLVVGLDAMVARLVGGAEEAGHSDANKLILRSTYTLAVFSAFSVVAISLFVEPILTLWFGNTLTDTGWTPEISANLFRIMSFGIAASILSEGWMKFLSGRGDVTAYAPHLLVAGFANAAAVILASLTLDDIHALQAIAFAFSGSFLIVNFGFIGVNTARRLRVRLWRFYAVVALPALVAGLAAIPGVMLGRGGWGIPEALGTLAILSVAAALMLWGTSRIVARVGQ